MAASVLTPEESAAVRNIAARHDAAEKAYEMYGRRGTRDPAVADRGALLRIIDRLSASPWRPVTEAEPAEGVRVLIARSLDSEPRTGYYRAPENGHWATWIFEREARGVREGDIWMPLPSLPEGSP